MLFITSELLYDGYTDTLCSTADDVTIMTSSSKKFQCVFKIKFPTKRIFQIFPVLRINAMAPFCRTSLVLTDD